MPKICDLIADKARKNEEWVSYEYYPPRTADGVRNLEARFVRMAKAQQPLFCDMTWGAGGSTSELTLDLTLKMKKLGLEPNMHLTCTNVAKADVVAALDKCKAAGVCNIVALRGDPPVGQEKWSATEGGFECALDLVAFIRKQHGDFFCLSVAGYPEGHPDAITEVDAASLTATEKVRCRVDPATKICYVCRDAAFAKELAYLKAKVDAGADMILTQMFFDVQTYAAFVQQCRAAGINVPVVPGIMLVQAYGGFKKMTSICKTRVPDEIAARLHKASTDEDELKQAGVDLGFEMCKDLKKCGAPGLHFYTLNLEKTTLAICKKLEKDSDSIFAKMSAAHVAVATLIVGIAASTLR